MAKSSTVYICQNCGERFLKWMGQCSNCGQWNTLVESVDETTKKTKKGQLKSIDKKNLISYSDINFSEISKRRYSTGMGEFDRVLGQDQGGAGIVPGAVMLIGGEPGIGKSTLLTQLVVRWLLHPPELDPVTHLTPKLLYIAGEESPHQISLRINRIIKKEQHMLAGNEVASRLIFVTSTDVDEVVTAINQEKPQLVIVDSIHTLTTSDLLGASGSVGQLRESTERIANTAKQIGCPVFLVGHVTKEGTIAGPKVLEHIVDTVLELSGERTGQLRILRAIKNRFGATDEVGLFQMKEEGFVEVTNPSELFLVEHVKAAPGSATVCIMEGTRPLLIEVQALVVDSQLAMPRRVGRGIQLPRLQVLAAVLQKHARLPLGSCDVFVNLAGGFTITEPGIDLGICVAIASSLKNKPLPGKTVFLGEVGLLGEIRSVNFEEQRSREAKRLGYTQVISRQSYPHLSKLFADLGLS